MLFGKNLGTLSSALLYDRGLSFRMTEYIMNSIAVIAGAVLLYFIYSRFCKITKAVLIVGILSVFVVGALNIPTILVPYNWYKGTVGNTSEEPSIPLSKNGKNVMVIMLDRSIGTQVPYIFNEKPELLEKYDGFTYYENTISYSSSTITASPALFGGYDYTPEKINARLEDSLASKQDEALKVMPFLFSSNDYKVTICDTPFAGYKGTARAACTVTYSTLPSGVTLASNGNQAATTSADGSLTFNVASGANFGGNATMTGVITLTFTCDSKTFVRKFVWSKAITGATGATGAAGA